MSSRKTIGWVILAASALLALVVSGTVFSQQPLQPSAAPAVSPPGSPLQTVPGKQGGSSARKANIPGKVSEVSEKSGIGQEQDPRTVRVYAIPAADILTALNLFKSVGPDAQLTADRTGVNLIAYGTSAVHERIRDTLEKLASKEPAAAASPAGNSESMGQTSPPMNLYSIQPRSPYPPTANLYAPGGAMYPLGRMASMPNAFSPPANARPEDPQLKKLLQADAEMEKEAKNLVGLYHSAAGEKEQGETRTKLEELTNRHFDVRQERRGLELSRLEERLERVRASIEKREEARELVIRMRVSQLLGEGAGLEF